MLYIWSYVLIICVLGRTETQCGCPAQEVNGCYSLAEGVSECTVVSKGQIGEEKEGAEWVIEWRGGALGRQVFTFQPHCCGSSRFNGLFFLFCSTKRVRGKTNWAQNKTKITVVYNVCIWFQNKLLHRHAQKQILASKLWIG